LPPGHPAWCSLKYRSLKSEVFMSSQLASIPAMGDFVFSDDGRGPKKGPGLARQLSALPKLTGVTPASRLEVRPAPEMVSSGVAAIDALTGGLPRGCLTEICGATSSGRTSLLLAALAAATRRQEACALVDACDALHPHSAEAAGVDRERLLWVRCGADQIAAEKPSPQRTQRSTEKNRRGNLFMETQVEQALRVTDLLLQSGGFGMVAIDLGDVPVKTARRIPLTSWFRFQRAVECTPTVLFVITRVSCAQTCASLLLQVRSAAVGRRAVRQGLEGDPLSAISCSQLSVPSFQITEMQSRGDTAWFAPPSHAQVFEGLEIEGEVLRSRLERKPAGSVRTAFATKARAG
jgi:hypothetical protein